jgi:hypothetical protein
MISEHAACQRSIWALCSDHHGPTTRCRHNPETLGRVRFLSPDSEGQFPTQLLAHMPYLTTAIER